MAGSGTGTPAMNSKIAVKMIENMNHDCFACFLIFTATAFGKSKFVTIVELIIH